MPHMADQPIHGYDGKHHKKSLIQGFVLTGFRKIITFTCGKLCFAVRRRKTFCYEAKFSFLDAE